MVLVYFLALIMALLLMLVLIPLKLGVSLTYAKALQFTLTISPYAGLFNVMLDFQLKKDDAGKYRLYLVKKNGKAKLIFMKRQKPKRKPAGKITFKLIKSYLSHIDVVEISAHGALGIRNRADLTALSVGLINSILDAMLACLSTMKRFEYDLSVKPLYEGGVRLRLKCIIRIHLANIILESLKKEDVKNAATSH